MRFCVKVRWLFGLLAVAGNVLGSSDITLEATGSTREMAIANAISAASEQASGVMVISDQTLEGDRLTKDQIRQHTTGIVNKYEVVSCNKLDQMFTCMINANVSPAPLRMTMEGKGVNFTPIQGQSAAAEVQTYNQSINTGREFVLQALADWQQSLKLTVKDVKVQPAINGQPVIDLTYQLEVEPGYFKHLQAILDRVEDTNRELNKGMPRQNRSGYVDTVFLDAPEIGWWPRFYFLNDPLLGMAVAQASGMLAMVKAEVSVMDKGGEVMASGCDTVRSDFVTTGWSGNGNRKLEFKVGRPQERKAGFTLSQAQLSKVAGVKVSMGCSGNDGLRLGLIH